METPETPKRMGVLEDDLQGVLEGERGFMGDVFDRGEVVLRNIRIEDALICGGGGGGRGAVSLVMLPVDVDLAVDPKDLIPSKLDVYTSRYSDSSDSKKGTVVSLRLVLDLGSCGSYDPDDLLARAKSNEDIMADLIPDVLYDVMSEHKGNIDLAEGGSYYALSQEDPDFSFKDCFETQYADLVVDSRMGVTVQDLAETCLRASQIVEDLGLHKGLYEEYSLGLNKLGLKAALCWKRARWQEDVPYPDLDDLDSKAGFRVERAFFAAEQDYSEGALVDSDTYDAVIPGPLGLVRLYGEGNSPSEKVVRELPRDLDAYRARDEAIDRYVEDTRAENRAERAVGVSMAGSQGQGQDQKPSGGISS